MKAILSVRLPGGLKHSATLTTHSDGFVSVVSPDLAMLVDARVVGESLLVSLSDVEERWKVDYVWHGWFSRSPEIFPRVKQFNAWGSSFDAFAVISGEMSPMRQPTSSPEKAGSTSTSSSPGGDTSEHAASEPGGEPV